MQENIMIEFLDDYGIEQRIYAHLANIFIDKIK